LLQLMPQAPVAQTAMPVPSVMPVTTHASVRDSHAPKSTAAKAPKTRTEAAKLRSKNSVEEDIVIPTFMSSLPKTPTRRPSAKASSTLKVAHG
jgi:hypothetical protein